MGVSHCNTGCYNSRLSVCILVAISSLLCCDARKRNRHPNDALSCSRSPCLFYTTAHNSTVARALSMYSFLLHHHVRALKKSNIRTLKFYPSFKGNVRSRDWENVEFPDSQGPDSRGPPILRCILKYCLLAKVYCLNNNRLLFMNNIWDTS